MLSRVLFKAFLPFAHLIESVDDERGTGDGIWVYPLKPSCVAEGICSPGILHEDTVKQLVSQLRSLRDHVESNPDCARCAEQQSAPEYQ